MFVYKRMSAIVVIISMHGYKGEIDFLQFRHLPCKNNHEKTGILSYHAISVWHFGQVDRGLIIDLLCIKRYARTFKKDPQQRKNGIKK